MTTMNTTTMNNTKTIKTEETFTMTVTKGSHKHDVSSYECNGDTFETKLTPSQMEAIRKEMRFLSICNETNDKFEIHISVIGKHALVFTKKLNISTMDIFLNRGYKHMEIGKRGKVTEL